MSLSKEDVLNAIAEMSVMDVVELISDMEEKVWRFSSSSGCCSGTCGRWRRSSCRRG